MMVSESIFLPIGWETGIGSTEIGCIHLEGHALNGHQSFYKESESPDEVLRLSEYAEPIT